MGVTSLAAKQVCLSLGPYVKHVTCTDFVAKSRTNLYFLQRLFATCNNHTFDFILLCFEVRVQ